MLGVFCLLGFKFFPSRMLMGIITTSIAVLANCLLAFCKGTSARLAGFYLNLLGHLGLFAVCRVYLLTLLGIQRR